jgi:hypothetical protein
MLGKPFLDRSGFSVGQQVNDPPALQITKDGAVALPAAPCPIVDADNAQWLIRYLGTPPNQPEKAIGTQRDRKPPCHACCRPTTKSQAEVIRNQVHPAGPTPVSFSDIGQTLGKDRSWASGDPTSKSTHDNPDDDRTTVARHVVKRSPIATMHRSRERATKRTSTLSSTCAGMDDQPVGLNFMALDQQGIRN